MVGISISTLYKDHPTWYLFQYIDLQISTTDLVPNFQIFVSRPFLTSHPAHKTLSMNPYIVSPWATSYTRVSD